MSSSFAKWYDFVMGPLERWKFQGIRKELLEKASGRVLELGSGTGINFPLYKQVDSVTAIEPNEYMIEQSIFRKKKSAVPMEIVHTGAEELPFADGAFDSVVATLVFCTIPDVDKAVSEMKRVCKQDGKILLFEHVKMENRILAKLQDWLTPFWQKIGDGCCLNRDTISLFTSHGFNLIEVRKFYKGLFIVVEMRK